MPDQQQSFEQYIQDRFGGVLYPGSHEPDGQACTFEARSQYLGLDWTDDPDAVGRPDYRQLNDAQWGSNEARTKAMIELDAAFEGWEDWSDERRQRWAEAVVLRTGREVLPIALDAVDLPEHATACREAETLPELEKAAAWAADAADAADAAAAAVDAADAADAAAAAVDAADAADILHLACRIWIEEAQATAEERGKGGATP